MRLNLSQRRATGIRVIGGLLPCGKGQRIGIPGTYHSVSRRQGSHDVSPIDDTMTQMATLAGMVG
ncbi:MAG TPA: hypothetical protein VNH18_27900 [Bryobacteraceae bacterium]|nr:hypothetical protein [Bryobacteraceae bacterium]